MNVEMNRMSEQHIDDAHMLNHLISRSPNAFSTDFLVSWNEAYIQYCRNNHEPIVLEKGADS